MEVLHWLQELRTPFLNRMFEFFTLFGEETLLIAAVCLLYWCVNKRCALKIAYVFFLSGLLIQVMKITFRIERPWLLDETLIPVASALSTATGYSFPSGHMQSACAFFGMLAFSCKKTWQRLLCIFTMAAVGVSRLYLGVHTPADVLTSFLLTLVVLLLVERFYDAIMGENRGRLILPEGQLLHGAGSGRTPTKRQIRKLTAATLMIFAAAVVVYTMLMLSQGYIEAQYAEDCCKAAGAALGFAAGIYMEWAFVRFKVDGIPLYGQAIKYGLGIAGVLALKSGLKQFALDGMTFGIVRYCIVVIWIVFLYPYIWTQFRIWRRHRWKK